MELQAHRDRLEQQASKGQLARLDLQVHKGLKELKGLLGQGVDSIAGTRMVMEFRM